MAMLSLSVLFLLANAVAGAGNSCKEMEYHEFGFGAPKRLDSLQVWSADSLWATTILSYAVDGKLQSIRHRTPNKTVLYSVEATPRSFLARISGEAEVSIGKYFSADFRLDSSRGNLYRQYYRYTDTGYLLSDNDQGPIETTDSVRYTSWGQLHFRKPGSGFPDSCFAKPDTCECRNAFDTARNRRTVFRNGLRHEDYFEIEFAPTGSGPEKYLQRNRYFWSDRAISIANRPPKAEGPEKRRAHRTRADGRRIPRP